MRQLNVFFEKIPRINLVLFLCSFGIYFLYFHHIFFHLNSILSSITADSLKNYYTYVYHVKNDPQLLQFTGMNYPYGEHVIYTDCQPILTFILRLLPFTHPYLVGIMHGLIFFSFIITPVILNKILRILGIDKAPAFFMALTIALLSPQFVKINAGHFALAYGCLIPLSVLLVLRGMQAFLWKNIFLLFAFNTLLFLLHPYLGFCLSLFSGMALFIAGIFPLNKRTSLRRALISLIPGLAPLICFKLFMLLTDHHLNRTTEPFGAEMMVENLDSILSPAFGPFQKLMELFLNQRPGHYEGHTYLGFYSILLFVLLLGALPFLFRKIRLRKEELALFIAAFIFLMVSFGVHLKLLNLLHLQSAMLNQFRAVCRFAWIFYFVWPLCLTAILYRGFKDKLSSANLATVSLGVSLLLFVLTGWEANYFFTESNSVFWKYRNFFHQEQLNTEEKKVLAQLNAIKPQAILPLPLFHGGSELFERTGSNNSMLPAMIYSYHSATPILSVLMSRTSLNETKDLIQLLNSYKEEKPALAKLNAASFFVLTTNDPLLPDEARLYPSIKQFGRNDTLQFGYLGKKELLTRKFNLTSSAVLNKNSLDSCGLVFIHHEERKPFLSSSILDYETIYKLDSNSVHTGKFVVSFHYHYNENNYRALACNLIVNRINHAGSEWAYNIPVRIMSGFYEGYGVFEYPLQLDKADRYEFILKGLEDRRYTLSDFMLRPADKDVLVISSGRDSSFNNFPKR